MANLTNSAKLIQEMAKKANRTELPEVNNSTVNFTVNGNTWSQSMTTNQASNSTVNLTVNKTTVWLGNVDNTSDANKPISTATQAALDLKADKSDLSSVYKYKWSVASYSNLPSTWLTAWDVYNVEDTWMNYAWTGSAWDALGASVDLSNYLAKNNTTAFTPTWDYNPATKKYVDDRDTYIGGSEPTSNKVEWRLWYDTRNDQLKVYDWANWNVTRNEYHVWEWIEIWTVQDYSAMQWPCPNWFHVPLTTEWQTVKNIWTALWGWSNAWNDFWIALKLPYAGGRNSSASIVAQGTGWYYWSSSRYNASDASSLNLTKYSIFAQSSNGRANSFSVRCFKDTPTVPTSSWTKLYWTSIEAWWIFWSSADWLISMSSDWQTWITITDKNLGATTVWNSWDTLSEANCGKYYQWWNNYWFPRTWSVTTSSTQVDASNYWPWNYYSSSTFITYDGRWDTTDNWNLWWWKTWVVTIENAITNTGVLSVNWQTWDVTIASPDMSNYLAKDNTTAFTPTGNYNPATKKYVDDNKTEYTAGEWIDITNDEIWLDGTYEWKDYSAMQWPAPSGFHVPTKDEWVALCGILTSTFGMASNATTMGTYLKMPMAGSRYSNTTNVNGVGTGGRYWSSSQYSKYYAYYLSFSSSALNSQDDSTFASGYSVRCFKDAPISFLDTPLELWTVLYQGSWNAWIYRNQNRWIISVSWDWTTWYTIMDKNLGATTVFNQWDTLTDVNCGNFYQWGNNYWFAHSWTLTTSSTAVDVTWYWPWNYYSSSTWITVTPRFTTTNGNLRWWVTWILQASWKLIVWDNLYKIVTSTSAPASWTASNIITIVTD